MNLIRKLAVVFVVVLSPMAANADVITPTAVTCSSRWFSYDCEDLINDSGLSGGLHDRDYRNMWLNEGAGASGLLTFDLGALFDLVSVDIWQYSYSLVRGVNGFDA